MFRLIVPCGKMRIAGTVFGVYMGVRIVCGSQTNTTGAQCWNADVSETLSMAALPAQSACAPAIRSCNYDLIDSNSFPLLEKHLLSGCLSSIKKASGLLHALFIAGVVVIYLGKVLGHGGNYS